MSQIYDRGLSNPSSRSSSQNHKKLKDLPLDFFIEKKFISQDELKPILEETKTYYNIKSIYLNSKNQIPGIEGTAFTIHDSKNFEAANKIFSTIEQKKKQPIDVIYLIPEGTVSYIIGQSGGQIKKIMYETKTTIVVNQPINEFLLRTVKITGDCDQIHNAIKIITKKLLERGVTQDDYTKKAEALDPRRIITKAKFLFYNSMIDSIVKSREIERKYYVKLKAKSGSDIKLKDKLKKDEGVLQIEGSLVNVQEAIQSIIKKISQSFKDFDMKIVMPGNFASKLIGAKGCQIKELATKSKGAQIKVLSDKDDTDPEIDCLVQVTGSIQNKQDATILILEQIECFRNGGPILESGKYINENFAQQYKNQVKVQDVGKKRQRSSSSRSYKRSRSRSSSYRKHRHNQYSSDRSSQSSNKRKLKPKMIKTKLIVPLILMAKLEKQNRFNKLKNEFKVNIRVYPNELGQEATVKLNGEMKDCLGVVEEVLNEQCKLLMR